MLEIFKDKENKIRVKFYKYELGFPISRFAYNEKGWKTVTADRFDLNRMETETLALSPISTDGRTFFIGFDIDERDLLAVQSILQVLPSEAKPLVSDSGYKGFHVILFLTDGIETRKALCFTRKVTEVASVKCETFPSSVNSKCLKLPGSKNPKSNKIERFLDTTDLSKRLDNLTIWKEIESGLHKTRPEVIDKWLDVVGEDISSKPRNIGRNFVNEINQIKPLPNDELAKIDDLAIGLAKIAGREISGIGESFLCILPGHDEENPSANFYRSNNGSLVYKCWHDEGKFLTLGEAYFAYISGRTSKLKAFEKARCLAHLAISLGFRNLLCLEVMDSIAKATKILQNIYLNNINSIFIKQLVNEQLEKKDFLLYLPVVGRMDKQVRSRNNLEAVWRVICYEALISAMNGFSEIKLSCRFVGRRSNVEFGIANKMLNAFCVIGIIEKIEGSGGLKGDRFRFSSLSEEQVKQRWLLLGRPMLRKIDRNLAAERLGEEIAKRIFRN